MSQSMISSICLENSKILARCFNLLPFIASLFNARIEENNVQRSDDDNVSNDNAEKEDYKKECFNYTRTKHSGENQYDERNEGSSWSPCSACYPMQDYSRWERFDIEQKDQYDEDVFQSVPEL